MNHNYTATVRWNREGATFTDFRYSRGHEWSFDGGVKVPASSSPLSVPFPLSVAEAVDPEEALVASAASCHMLWFLALAAKQGFIVENYEDEAYGVMGKDASGKMAFSSIMLRPQIRFQGTPPTADQVRALHHAAHEECFIARSLKCAVTVESEVT